MDLGKRIKERREIKGLTLKLKYTRQKKPRRLNLGFLFTICLLFYSVVCLDIQRQRDYN